MSHRRYADGLYGLVEYQFQTKAQADKYAREYRNLCFNVRVVSHKGKYYCYQRENSNRKVGKR